MPIFKGLEKKREVKNWGLKKKMGAKKNKSKKNYRSYKKIIKC